MRFGGFTWNPKKWARILGFLLAIFLKGGGLNYLQKFWGSLEVILRYFLGCLLYFFFNLLKQKIPKRCPKQLGRGGSRPLLESVQKKAVFFLRKTFLTGLVWGWIQLKIIPSRKSSVVLQNPIECRFSHEWLFSAWTELSIWQTNVPCSWLTCLRHSPNLPYSKRVGSPVAALPIGWTS